MQLKECYHTNNHNRVWSETQASGVVTLGVKNRFGPHCTPPPILTPPPNSREQELSRYTDPTQLHKCYHTNNHNRVRSETQASRVVTLGVKNRFGPHCTPHPIMTPPILENKSYPGITTYLVPSPGDHSIL